MTIRKECEYQDEVPLRGMVVIDIRQSQETELTIPLIEKASSVGNFYLDPLQT